MRNKEEERFTRTGKVLLVIIALTAATLIWLARKVNGVETAAEFIAVVAGGYAAAVAALLLGCFIYKLAYCLSRNTAGGNGAGCVRGAASETRSLFGLFLLMPFLAIVLPVIAIVFLVDYTKEFLDKFRVFLRWIPSGKYILLVYSDSPRHKERIERVYLPKFGGAAVVMNWSRRREWGMLHGSLERSLATRYFRLDTGLLDSAGKRYARYHMPCMLPGVVVFRPWYAPKVFLLGDAFREHRHGKPYALNRFELELFRLAGQGAGRGQ